MPERANPLTPTLTRVLQLLADHDTAEVADLMYLSRHTIKTHTREIRIRTGTRLTLHAVVLGLRNGWIT